MKLLLALFCVTALSGAVFAEGTETIGPAAITIATGSGTVAAGVGLAVTQPGTINLNVPAGVTIKQVLLYWEGQSHAPGTGDNTITVGGNAVVGTLLGGPTLFFQDVSSTSYRADITALGLISPGANSVQVSGLTYTYANDGAGILVIYDDGLATADIQVRDGNDLAYHNFAPPLNTTAAQTYFFAAAATDRTANINLFFSSVEGPISGTSPHRPNSIDVTVGPGGPITRFSDVLVSSNGPEWDTITLSIGIPAGVTQLTVQAFSRDDLGSPDDPASFCWVAGTLALNTGTRQCEPDDDDDHNGDEHHHGHRQHHHYGNSRHFAGGDDPPAGDDDKDDEKGEENSSVTAPQPDAGDEAVGLLSTTLLGNGDVILKYTQSTDFSDNTYGSNRINWPVTRSFTSLLSGNKANFVVTDGHGEVVMDFVVDYLSVKGGTPSRYGTLGVLGGDGRMNAGRTSWILDVKTSAATNLNDLGLCRSGVCKLQGVDLLKNSPPADSSYHVRNNAFRSWNFVSTYTVRISHHAFGSAGFGGASVPVVFNTPTKQSSTQTNTEPCDDDDHDGDDHHGDDHDGNDSHGHSHGGDTREDH